MLWKWGIHASGVSLLAGIGGTLAVSSSAAGGVFASRAVPPGSPESFPAVAPGDSASLALKVYATPSVSQFLNASGDMAVQRGPGFTSVGAAPSGYGNYNVMASWEESLGANTNTIRVTWQTSNGQRFVPPGATIGGQSVGFVEWRVGATNPISWGPTVTQVDLVGAFLALSTNGGASLTQYEITGSLTNPWNGTSFGTTVPISMFANVNYVQAIFVYTPIPGPASVAALGLGAGLCAARRRRSGSAR